MFFHQSLQVTKSSRDELERFCVNFDLLLPNINGLHPACSIVLGDFKAKCSKWCASDRNNSTGIELDNITTTSGYNKMIDKPTIISMNCHHVLYNFLLKCKSYE